MSNAKTNFTSGFKKYRPVNFAANAYALTLGKLYIATQLPGPVHPFAGGLVAEIVFMGARTANHQDFGCQIWYAWSTHGDDRADSGNEYLLQFAGKVVPVLSDSLPGAAGGLLLAANERLAHTQVWTPGTAAGTPNSPLGVFETALAEGANGNFNGATGDTCAAMLTLPCVGRANGFVLDFKLNDGAAPAASANALILGKVA